MLPNAEDSADHADAKGCISSEGKETTEWGALDICSDMPHCISRSNCKVFFLPRI